jgi:hypothetical protein
MSEAMTGTSLMTGTSSKWADTIGTAASPGDLRGITGTSSVHSVVAGGFWSIGDGGGGVFYWDPNASAADDGGTIINPTGHSGNGRWRRSYSGPVNVRWFGAVGNGSTPDDTAFGQAISVAQTNIVSMYVNQSDANFAAELNATTSVYVPPGIYELQNTLTLWNNTALPINSTNSFRLYGDGLTSCLKFTGGGDGILIQSSTSYTRQLPFEIDHLWIRATSTSAANGINLISGGNQRLHDLLITGWQYFITLNGAEMVDVATIVFTQNVVNGEGYSLSGTVGVNMTGESGQIPNVMRVHSCTFNGPQIGLLVDGGTTHHVYDNNLNGGMYFAHIRGCQNGLYEQNYFEGHTGSAFYIDGGVSNLVIRSSQFSSPDFPAVVFAGSGYASGFDFSNNQIAGVVSAGMIQGSAKLGGPITATGNWCPASPLFDRQPAAYASALYVNRDSSGGSNVGINSLKPAAALDLLMDSTSPALSIHDVNYTYLRLSSDGKTLSHNALNGFSGDIGSQEQVAYLQTTNAIPVTAITYVVPSNKSVRAEMTATGLGSNGDNAATFKCHVSLYRWGDNNVALIGPVVADDTEQTSGAASWNATLTTDSTNLYLRITGPSNDDVNWVAVLKIVQGGN